MFNAQAPGAGRSAARIQCSRRLDFYEIGVLIYYSSEQIFGEYYEGGPDHLHGLFDSNGAPVNQV